MKDFLRLLVLAIPIGLIAIFLTRQLDSKKINKLGEQLKEQTVAANIAKEQEAKIREARETEIGALQGHIDSLNTVIARLEGEVEERIEVIGERDKRLEEMAREVQPVIDANPKLKEYVDGFKLAIEDRDRVIFSLRDALLQTGEREKDYQKQLLHLREVGESWRRQYEIELKLRSDFEAAFLRCQQSLIRVRAREKWIAAGAGIVGVLLGSVIH